MLWWWGRWLRTLRRLKGHLERSSEEVREFKASSGVLVNATGEGGIDIVLGINSEFPPFTPVYYLVSDSHPNDAKLGEGMHCT